MDAYNVDDVWRHFIERAMSHGNKLESRDGGCMELLGQHFTLMDLDANFVQNPVRKLSESYAAAELLWYLSGDDSIDMIRYYAPQYDRFAENGKAWGAYGYRWKHDRLWTQELFKCVHAGDIDLKQDDLFDDQLSQLQGVAKLLGENPNSRQAVVNMWNGGDLAHAMAKDKKDIPCTIAMVFNVRADKLHLHVMMRSQDLWLGLPYDVWCFTTIQKLMAEALGYGYGNYYHSVSSLHLYDKHVGKAVKAKNETYQHEPRKFAPHKCSVKDAIARALYEERIFRFGYAQKLDGMSDYTGHDSLMNECIRMIRTCS